MRGRFAMCSLLLLLAVSMLSCEEGDKVDIGPGPGGSRVVTLEVQSATPLKRGQPVELRANVADEGVPAQGVSVSFSASPNTVFQPNPASSDAQGNADTVMSTAPNQAQYQVTATAGSVSRTETLTLEP